MVVTFRFAESCAERVPTGSHHCPDNAHTNIVFVLLGTSYLPANLLSCLKNDGGLFVRHHPVKDGLQVSDFGSVSKAPESQSHHPPSNRPPTIQPPGVSSESPNLTKRFGPSK